MGVLSHAKLFIAGSTGPTHIANALAIPHIGIYSPIKVQSSWRWGPFHRNENVSVMVPDVICVGKALSGGFPISACVGKESVMDAWPESTGEALHTSTFLGNPVGCAMGLASLEILQRPETIERVIALIFERMVPRL